MECGGLPPLMFGLLAAARAVRSTVCKPVCLLGNSGSTSGAGAQAACHRRFPTLLGRAQQAAPTAQRLQATALPKRRRNHENRRTLGLMSRDREDCSCFSVIVRRTVVTFVKRTLKRETLPQERRKFRQRIESWTVPLFFARGWR